MLPSTVFAIGPPDSSSIGVTHAYIFEDVLVPGDALYLANFNLHYNTTPDDPVTDTWEGIVFEDTLTTDVIFGPQAPLYADQSPFNGYNEGIFGIYTEEIFVVGDPDDLKICLNPVDVVGGTRLCTSSITTYEDGDITTLNDKLIEMFEDLEKEWRLEDSSIDLIEPLSDITKLLTIEGGDYASNNISSIQTILPSLFPESVLTATIMEESYDTSATDTTTDFFDGTELDTGDPNSSLGAISTYTKIPVSIIGLAIVMALAAAIAGAIISSTGRSEVGMLAGVMVITGGTYVGLVPFALAGIFAMLGALSLGYIFFYKSSTS